MKLRLYVHVPSQTVDLLDETGAVVRRYVVSTSRHGLGTEPGSNRTPTGRFTVAEKHGDGAAEGAIFVARQPTGELGREDDEKDHVQTRILWLAGLDPENANTYERYVYFHGTNAESKLGTPASEGCIRMSNADICDLYDRVTVGTEVTIDGGDDAPGVKTATGVA